MVDTFPKAFGKYQLLAPLAQGGMGALFLAVAGAKGMEKLCVVKTVLPHLADHGYVARFRDEAMVVVKLSHGNLVSVFDAGQVGGELFLAMDFVEGRDLRTVWNRCAQKSIAFPVDIAVYLVKELCRGLSYAHSFGELRLVHRDVSPPNVLISYAGEVKLTDFGLAFSTMKVEKTAPGIIYGKVSYMSPEQARGEPLDGRTDLYAAGIILWELLTGRQLFPVAPGGKDADELVRRAKGPAAEPPLHRSPRVPPSLNEIVMRALEPEPRRRFQTGEEMRAALAGWLAETTPATDAARLETFMAELFGDDMARERSERTSLIEPVRAAAGLGNTRIGLGPALEYASSPDGSAEELLGEVIDGRYEIRALVGEGGMGRVYEAEHNQIGRRVAVKVLHPFYSRMPDVVERFRREARAASRVGHPNIVDVTDSGTTSDGSVYFVMEFLEGEELADIIGREGALDPERALRIGVQICRALGAAHEAGVVHRDLKPENIFLIGRDGQDDFVKVLDFGIAKSAELEKQRTEHLTRPGVAMGTPEYMAPEQAAGNVADSRSDVYSVGAILYEMLLGSPPYDGNSFMEVLNRKATTEPRPLLERKPALPRQISSVVMKALARAPDERHQSMGSLADALSGCLTDLARAKQPLPPTPKHRARPVLYGALALGGLVIMLVGWQGMNARGRRAPLESLSAPHQDRELLVTMEEAEPISAGTRPVDSAERAPRKGRDSETTVPKLAVPETRQAPSPKRVPAAVRTQRVPSPSTRELTTAALPAEADVEMEAASLLAEARALAAEMRWSRARVLYERVAQGQVARAGGYLGLAMIAFETKDTRLAIEQATRALEAGGGNSARMLLGHACYKEGRFAEAIQQYREILAIAPESKEAARALRAAEKRVAEGK